MRKYSVEISGDAINDIVNLRESLNTLYADVYNTEKVVTNILSKIDSLATFPKRAMVFANLVGQDLRVTRSGRYTVVYYVDDEKGLVRVQGVFHSHRNIDGLLEERLR